MPSLFSSQFSFFYLLCPFTLSLPPSPKCCFLGCKICWLLSQFSCHFIIFTSSVSIVNLVLSLEACNTKSVKRTMSARKIGDYSNCCFGMDQYWICEKKILVFVSYSIGILKLVSGNNSSHPDYRTSETFLSLYFLVPADCLCFQTLALLRVGGKAFCLPCPPQLSLVPQLAEQSSWEQQHIPGSVTSQSVPSFRVCSVL